MRQKDLVNAAERPSAGVCGGLDQQKISSLDVGRNLVDA